MGYKVITISREYGSGGRNIGQMVAKALGIKCYDGELIDKIAEESGLTTDFIEENSEENFKKGGFFSSSTQNLQDRMFNAQRNVILDLAAKEPCVIIGRCADMILYDNPDSLRAFIHAPVEYRLKRIKDYGDPRPNLREIIRDQDRRKAAYYQIYTDSEFGNFKNYHITLETEKIDLDTCVNILCDLYNKM